jgi:methionyl-tRNA formyltransferase
VRIGVAATAPIGADVLERLAASHEIAFLLTRPDAPRGRGRKLAPPPAKEAAERLGIPVHQPERPELPLDVDRVVVCAYGLYIPPRQLARSLWLNVHPSLLPRWRGAAPVERAILAGDAETGVTIHETIEALDSGPIAAQEAFPIGDVLESPEFAPQAEAGATYAEKITPADRELHLSDPVDSWRRIRALSPHIGARTELHGRRVTIWQARLEGGELVPEVVQPEGRGRMRYDDFVRGVR